MTGVSQGTRPDWQSRWIDINGPLRYIDYGGPADGPVIMCVHGLGGSAVNWSAIAALLPDRYRVLAPDLAGHGLTQSMGRGTDVAANQALLHRFIQTVTARPVILMGNSMGGMISLLEASAAPRSVAGLILLGPALPFVPARLDPVVTAMFALYVLPGIGRVMMNRRRRLAPEELVARIMSLCCVDPSRIPAEVVADHVDVARQRAAFTDVNQDYAAAMRSVVAIAGHLRGQSYRHAISAIRCPVLVLHGDKDRLVPVTAARAAAHAHPSWSVVVMSGVGHVPQLEVPRDTARLITEWLGSAGLRAAQAASGTPSAPAH
jgi:pimeloyl-ACP methyl ester carboxylesterase